MPDTPTPIREAVRDRYAAAARAVSGEEPAAEGCCGPPASSCCGPSEPIAIDGVFGSTLYDEQARGEGGAALEASLGCGNPTAIAELHPGETVLDLGSGAGGDVLLSARRVGPSGQAIGLDMTDEMLELARSHARGAGLDNVEFVKGYIEEIPLPDAAVDIVISNCVINLSGDKRRVIGEVARVLRPGGRLAFGDVLADASMDDATRADMEQWTGCIAGALTEAEFRAALQEAGLVDVEIRETHRVHEHAGSAVIRAVLPAG